MAILAQCPICRGLRSLKIQVCTCGEDLGKAKRSGRVRYWIQYRLPNGKQRKELVGTSINDARAADGKRKAQKKEGRIFDMLPESKITFSELSEWYLDLKSVKKLASYDRVGQALKAFKQVFGDRRVNEIKQTDIEGYQEKRKTDGRADATVDMEIKTAQAMVSKAFDNDMIDGRVLKAFRRTRKLLILGANARSQLVSLDQFQKLLSKAPSHYRGVLILAMHTGMRLGEIKGLKWSHIDRQAGMIRLPAGAVKEHKAKSIPINHHVKKALDALPHAIHHDFVITYQGQPMNGKSSLKKNFPEVCERAGIPYGRETGGGITFHDLRRTFKTNLVQAGVIDVYRNAILGHTLKGMDVHYVVPVDEALTAAMEKYTKWFDDRFANVTQNVTQRGAKNDTVE